MATQTRQSSTNSKSRTPSGVLQTAQKDAKPLQAFFTKFVNDWSMSFAGMLAYSLLMAMVPIAIAIIAILGLILNHLDPTALNNIITQMVQIFPGAAHQQNTIQVALKQLGKSAGILGIIAILLAVFAGSRLFIAIEGCLDIVYRVRPRAAIQQNLMAIGMLLLFIILIPIMVVASSAPTVVISILKRTPLNVIPGIDFIFSLGGIAGALLAAFILFEAIYFIVPNQRISWRNSWKGALVAAVLLEIFLVVFPLYTTRLMSGYAGPIGFAVILLLFFYYFAVILLLGAEINASFFEQVRPMPNDLATFVSTMAGKLNRDIPEAESPHQNTQPTDRADEARMAATLDQGKKVRRKNVQQQHEVTSTALAKDKVKTKETTTRGPSKLTTAVGVIVGSALAFLIETLRLRQRAR